MANFRNNKPRIVVGIDEAGRGPLAGPVTAAAVFVAAGFRLPDNLLIRSSKQLTPKQRQEVYGFLKAHPQVEWGVGRVSEKVIDRINILQATKLAMRRAVFNLEKKLARPVDFLLIDGNFGIDLAVPQESIIKGDEKVPLISLASIVAKVHRDEGMKRYHRQYPEYGFAQHKGYGTTAHYAMLSEYGPCPIHRKTFRGVGGRLQN